MAALLGRMGAWLRQRWRNITVFREDNFFALRHFLAGQSRTALGVNIGFNLACKAARVCKRTLRRLRGNVPQKPTGLATLPRCDERVPPLRGHCALIAETSVPQCLHYRVKERTAQLRHLGWSVRECSWCDFDAAVQALQLASFVIFYRVPMLGGVPALYAEARRLGLPIIFDIDDLIFDRKLYAEYLRDQSLDAVEINGLLDLADLYRKSLDAADILMTSTATLAELMPGPDRDDTCFVVHNSLARSLENMAQSLHGRTPRQDGEIRLFYGSGSRTHDVDFALIADTLLEALREDERLHLYLHGYLKLSQGFEDCAHRVHRIAFLDKKTYYRVIADYDIALVPLEKTLFNDAKSNIKYQEASIFGLPSIVSPGADFLEAVTDGVDGCIAHTPEQWRDALRKLAASPELRVDMGEKARQNVLARYAARHVAEKELRRVLPVLPAADKPRVLLVNVLFGKNSFGGATMVVEESASQLQQQGFEVYVFSTLCVDGIASQGLARYGWNGSTVIAANVSLRDGDSTPPGMARLFRQALRAVQPGIVHFHCIQSMGLGMLRECQRASIPYVITMHDAWWICPRQFMMDKSNTYCAQAIVRPEFCHQRCGLSDKEIYSRQMRMREAVSKAEAVLTPSSFYTDFVRRNFPHDAHKVQVNRNGIQQPEGFCRSRTSGPIRLGFLGGKTTHKGYFFLAEALRALGRTDFELVLVDVHAAFGQGAMTSGEDKTLWQGLPVRILPFVSHEAIDTVYAQMDVLLFPSLWDESFGLTVREAIVRDVFVVAAECGGPSEAIVHGENGFLFPKGDRQAFQALLQHILDAQEAHKAYRTSNRGDVIDVAAQTRELAALYHHVLRPGVASCTDG